MSSWRANADQHSLPASPSPTIVGLAYQAGEEVKLLEIEADHPWDQSASTSGGRVLTLAKVRRELRPLSCPPSDHDDRVTVLTAPSTPCLPCA